MSHTPEEAAKCKIYTGFPEHQRRYREAREEYQRDKEWAKKSPIPYYTADLMKVFLLPKLTTKEHVFVSWLVTFKKTFATLNDKMEHILILWHEGVAGRSAQDVVSSYLKVIELSDGRVLVFWAENWFLFTVLDKALNNPSWNVDRIRIKYLQKGHTYMRADSLHGSFGSKLKAKEEIIDFAAFSNICRLSRKNIRCVHMTNDNFFDIDSEVRSQKTKAGKNMPYLEEIVEVEFRRNDRKLWFKKSFSEEYIPCEFLIAKCKVNDFPARRTNNQKDQTYQKEDILELLRLTPSVNRSLWESLHVNDSVKDLMDSNELEKPESSKTKS